MIRVEYRLAIGLLLPATGHSEMPTAPSILVETAVPREQMLKRTVQGYGTVATSEDDVVGISFAHAGQISMLRARPGEVVNITAANNR
jgi:hypothetical protein